MSPAAFESFGARWARDNLTRAASPQELAVLDMFPATCGGDEAEAGRRARRYYRARGRDGLAVWRHWRPDDEDVLSSCQDAYIVPLRVRSVGGRRLTLVRLPAPAALDRPLSIEALVARWLMILDLRYIVPLRVRSVGGRRLTLVRLPAPAALDRPLSIKALVARWLMILDLRVREETAAAAGAAAGAEAPAPRGPSEEVMLVDVCDLQASHFKQHFRGPHWRDFFYCLRSAHPKKFAEIHIVNTHRLHGMSLLLLRAGLYPWRRRITRLHPRAEHLNQVLGSDYFPLEGLPYEYGGRGGALKDLNDEWTKKLLSNARWLEAEEKRFAETELKPAAGKVHSRALSEVRLPGLRNGRRGSYHVLCRARSEKSLAPEDDMEEGASGHYRTLKVASDHGFYG